MSRTRLRQGSLLGKCLDSRQSFQMDYDYAKDYDQVNAVLLPGYLETSKNCLQILDHTGNALFEPGTLHDTSVLAAEISAGRNLILTCVLDDYRDEPEIQHHRLDVRLTFRNAFGPIQAFIECNDAGQLILDDIYSARILATETGYSCWMEFTTGHVVPFGFSSIETETLGTWR